MKKSVLHMCVIHALSIVLTATFSYADEPRPLPTIPQDDYIGGYRFPAGTKNNFEIGCQAAIDYYASSTLKLNSAFALSQIKGVGFITSDVKQFCVEKTARVFASWFFIFQKNGSRVPDFRGDPMQDQLHENFVCLNNNMQKSVRFAGFLTGFRIYMGVFLARENGNPAPSLGFLRDENFQWEVFMVCTNAERAISKNELSFMQQR